jgi:hypothetical protein
MVRYVTTEQFLLEKLEVAYLLKKYTKTYNTAIFILFFHEIHTLSLHIPALYPLNSSVIRLIFHIVPSTDHVTSKFFSKTCMPILPIVRKVNEFSSGWWEALVDLSF